MKYEEALVLLATALKKAKDVTKEYRIPCYLYEDRISFASILTVKQNPPRIITKYINEDTLLVIHALLKCVPTFPSPLFIYLVKKSDFEIKENYKKKAEKFLCTRYPILCEAITKVSSSKSKIVIDGTERSKISDLVFCPSLYSIVILENRVVFVGNRRAATRIC